MDLNLKGKVALITGGSHGLGELARVFEDIKKEIENTPELLLNAPENIETKWVDELKALKEPVFKE